MVGLFEGYNLTFHPPKCPVLPINAGFFIFIWAIFEAIKESLEHF